MVEQHYFSNSESVQNVEIIDKYISSREVVEAKSFGTNSVIKGNLYCMVNKPQEVVNHQGFSPEKGVIIWHREKLDPVSVEYFYERVKEDVYTITGWGYYGEDDLTIGPKTWFKAEYKRVYEKD